MISSTNKQKFLLTCFIISVEISSSRAHILPRNDFFENFVEVTKPPPESLEAVPKCGEGDQKGKFKCVPYFNCDGFTNEIVNYPQIDGSNNTEPRKNVRDPQCGHFLEVCCRVPNSTATSTGHSPALMLEFEARCGRKNGGDGDDGVFGEFPWMVALFNMSNLDQPFCGGSLISPVVVLTAAHCVEKFQNKQIKVRAGEWNLKTTEEKIPYQEKTVSEIIIHEHFLSTTLYNDVAILILDSSLSKSDNIGTICVPENLENINQNDCLVTGWGKVSLSENSHPNILKKLHFSKIANKDCENSLRKTIGNKFILDRSFICASSSSEFGTCMGDGGGPLVCPDSSQNYFQIGIVSWGVECGAAAPDVFTNVTQYRDWINFKLSELGYNSRPYTIS